MPLLKTKYLTKSYTGIPNKQKKHVPKTHFYNRGTQNKNSK